MGINGSQHSLDVLSYWCAVELFSPQSWLKPDLILLNPHDSSVRGRETEGKEGGPLPWEHIRADLFIGLVPNTRRSPAKLCNDLQQGKIYQIQTDMEARLTRPFSFGAMTMDWLRRAVPGASVEESDVTGIYERFESLWSKEVHGLEYLPEGTLLTDSMVSCLLQTVGDLAGSVGLPGVACAVYRKNLDHNWVKRSVHKKVELKQQPDKAGTESGQPGWLQHEYFRIETGLSQDRTLDAMITAAQLIRRLSPEEEVGQDEVLQELVSRQSRRSRKHESVASFMEFCIGDDGRPVSGSLQISQYAKAVSCLFNHHGWPECPAGWPHIEMLDEPEARAGRYFDAFCRQDFGAQQESKAIGGRTVTRRDIRNIIDRAIAEMSLDDDTVIQSPLYSERDGSPVIRDRVSYKLVQGQGPSEGEIMDSFFLGDLEDLYRGGVSSFSEPVRQYLSEGHPQRYDLASDDNGELLDSYTQPGCIPSGRWPSASAQFQSAGQQLAINQIRSAIEDPEGAPLLGVNGPPGTGKTTLLKDVVAEIIVARAKRLARLARPRDIFLKRCTAADTFMDKDRTYWTLDPSVTGYEIVVASSNNRAVENVSQDLPSADAIDEEWENRIEREYKGLFDGYYFRDFADKVVGGTSGGKGEPDVGASSSWALISAVLGKSDNKSKFLQPFKSDFIYGTLKEFRKQTRRGDEDWNDARRAFLGALDKEEGIRARKTSLFNLRHAYPDLCRQRLSVDDELKSLGDQIRKARSDREVCLRQIQILNRQSAEARHRADTAAYDYQQADYAYKAHVSYWGLHPLRSLFHGADRRRDELNSFTAARQAQLRMNDLCSAYCRIQGKLQSLQDNVNRGDRWLQEREDRASMLSDRLARLGEQIGQVEQQAGSRHGLGDDRVEWVDEEWNKARTEVFIQALALHQKAVEGAAAQFQDNLALAYYVMQSSGFNPDERLTAWQTFFLVVPVISTSFASVSRMLSGLGRQALGWAIVDEAGQAIPQSAAGLLQRVRHAVAVGDPMQIPPVDTMPRPMRELLASTHNIQMGLESDNMQVMVDYQTPCGLQDDVSGHWLGMPLVVHRRCDEPMFSICNDMAYSGRMIRKGPEHKPCTYMAGTRAGSELPPSCWYDVPAVADERGSTQWRPQEGCELYRRLRDLIEGGINPADILVMAPFKAVANKVCETYEDVVTTYGGCDPKTARTMARNHAGTVHTSQGREADVAFLVLGSRPGSRGGGSRSWVNSTPNLLNVAVSRAKRRIYVIGNLADWRQGTYTSRIAKDLPVGGE